MATYYVGIGGNDLNNGTTWLLRKATLNGAEDIPVAANDTVIVGPGVYRERLTCDFSGNAGNPITYIGDVTGQWTDGVGGIVRITGSNNDQTVTRTVGIDGNSKDYRTFRGFSLDTVSTSLLYGGGNADHWIVEDCIFQGVSGQGQVCFPSTSLNNVVRRCLFVCASHFGVYMTAAVATDNTNNLIENCMFIGGADAVAIYLARTGDMTVRNCLILGWQYGVRVAVAVNVGHAVDVNNCLICANEIGVRGTAVTDISEDFNTFYANGTDRTSTNVGGNSNTYPPLFLPPILFSGDDQLSGYKFPWWMGELSEWSQMRAITGNSEPAVDLRGMGRPTTASKNSWGPIQWQDEERDTTTTYDASTASVELSDAGRVQFKIPVDGAQITVSVRVYREANYAGVLPQMIIKQPGQADRTTTDVGAAGAWNELTDTFTPAADPEYIFVELVSNNTAVAGNYATYFDNLAVDTSPTLGEFEEWFTDRIGFDEVAAGGGGIAAPGFSPSTGIR